MDRKLGLLVCMGFLACAGDGKPGAASAGPASVGTASAGPASAGPVIEAHGDGQWQIRVERRAGAERAAGSVIVRQATAPDASRPPHVGLAAGRAWLALGRKFLDRNDATQALAAAREGIRELGPDYAGPETADDTELKLGAADERVKAGHPESGARMYLDMLENRLQLYRSHHGAVIAD